MLPVWIARPIESDGNPWGDSVVPAYAKTEQIANSPQIGQFSAPLTTTMDMLDVFGGSSLCILDYLATSNEWQCLIPTHVIYVDEKGVVSTDDGWVCEYYSGAKCVKLNRPNKVDADKADRSRGVPTKENYFPFGTAAHSGVRNLRRMEEETDYMMDMIDSELIDQSSGWGEVPQSEEEPQWTGSEDGKVVVEKFSMNHDDRLDYSKYVSKVIDTKRYYVLASPVENHAQVLWGNRER